MLSSHMWSSQGEIASPVSRARGQATFQQVRVFGDHGKDDSPRRIPGHPEGFSGLPGRTFLLGGSTTVIGHALWSQLSCLDKLAQVPQLL